ncbi:class I SAM-dependent methyltransferase [Patescibacteria group bacterium]|nr:class I SAM-dependent methyltransferase [Patescibacteria group bacterium]
MQISFYIMKTKAAKYLLEKTRKDYQSITSDFSNTRNWLWPEFEFFKKYIKEDGHLIDFGCGNGRFFEFVKDMKNLKYTGIDNNPKFIKIAQKNYTSTNFLVGDFTDIPRVSKADNVFAIASFHHIPSLELRKKSIQSLKAILKKDGILILTVWNLFQRRYRKYIIKSLFNYFIQLGKYDWNDTFIPWSNSGVNRYYHAFTPNELKNIFEKSGFEIIEMFYTKKGKKSNFLDSHNICMICKKK